MSRCGDGAQLVEHWTSTLLRQVQFPGAARDFSPKVNFQCRLSYSVHTPLGATARTIICAHIKDPEIHARLRVWSIMEKLKHPACTVGWVVQLCCSWLSLREATQIFHGRNPSGTIQLQNIIRITLEALTPSLPFPTSLTELVTQSAASKTDRSILL